MGRVRFQTRLADRRSFTRHRPQAGPSPRLCYASDCTTASAGRELGLEASNVGPLPQTPIPAQTGDGTERVCRSAAP